MVLVWCRAPLRPLPISLARFRSISMPVKPSAFFESVIMMYASLTGVIIATNIGTVIVVVILMRIWTTLHRKYFSNSTWSRTLERAHDAELGIIPYDMESEMLADPGEDIDKKLRIDTTALITKINTCVNTHFLRGTRTLERNLETEELLQQSVIGQGQDQAQSDADFQLNPQRLMSLLRDPKQRRDAAHHFILSSIFAALDIEGDSEQRSLVQPDYMSFVRSLKETGGSQCMSVLVLISSVSTNNFYFSLGLSHFKDSAIEEHLNQGMDNRT